MDDTFDRIAGTDTSGTLVPAELGESSPNLIHSRRYQPTFMGSFQALFANFDGLAFEQFTFLDCGSGKGRALLLASHFPFRQIIGVEFCRHLHEIAEQNIARYRSDLQRCYDLRSVYTDIVDYPLPTGSLFVYLFNPFEVPVLAILLDRLEESWRSSPRPILLCYVSPRHRELIASRTLFQPLKLKLDGTSEEDENYAIYGTGRLTWSERLPAHSFSSEQDGTADEKSTHDPV